MTASAGKGFRLAVAQYSPLPIVGTIKHTVRYWRTCGSPSYLLLWAGVANASFGLPDLGVTLAPMCCAMNMSTQASTLPIDIDTGWKTTMAVWWTPSLPWASGRRCSPPEDPGSETLWSSS